MADKGGGGVVSRHSAVCCNRRNVMTCSIKHEKVDALVASCTRLVRKASIGITTYIANGLCGGAPFSPRFSGGHGTRKAAITLGLQVFGCDLLRPN